MNALLPSDEAERLKVLAGYKILDTEAERNFDDITLLASHVCRTPIALISLVDENRQWFKSKIGMVERETARDIAFCAHGILEPDLFEVEDALADERFAANPLVTGNPKIRFYAGAPLLTSDGHALGMLCVIDQVPRELSPSEKAALKALSRQVVAQLELRRCLAEQKPAEEKLGQSLSLLRAITEGTTDAIYAKDREGCYIMINTAGARFVGKKPEEVIGLDDTQCFSDETRARIIERDRAIMKRGETRTEENISTTLAGTSRVYLTTKGPLRDSTGAIIGLFGVSRDITERKKAEAALAEQAIRYKTLMETSADSIYVLNERGDLQEANAAFLRRRGYTATEAKGLSVADWDAQWTREQLQERLQEELHKVDDGTMFETRHRCKDGSVFDVEACVTRVRTGGEQLFFCVTRDITERKQAEQALRESEARTRLLVKSSNVGLWDCNLLTNEVFFSPEWKSQLGYEDDEVPGRYEEWESRLHPEDRGACLRAVKDFREGRREDYDIEYRLRHKDGSWRSILARADLIRGAAGQPLRMMGCHIDITTRKQAEQALRESEERFRELAENINEVFFVWAVTQGPSRLLYVSPAYATIWGRSCESLYSSHQSWKHALHPDDREWVLTELSDSDLEKINDLTYRIVRPDQSVRWIRDRIFPVRDVNGVVVRFAEITEDITENKLAEEELQQVNEQLRDLSRRLFQVQDDERRHLARELHDEIGQALTAAKINLDSIESIEGSVQSLRLRETGTLLNNLLRQVRQISLDLHSSLLDDLGLAPALRSLLDQQGRRAGLCPRFDAVEPLENIDPEIQTTGFRIAQEAITNVLRHAKAQSVGVHLQTEAGQLRMKIVDDGSGFDLTEIECRAHEEASFGLMGMRERAALVGGRVRIISSPNKGTTIEISLPLHASEERLRGATP